MSCTGGYIYHKNCQTYLASSFKTDDVVISFLHKNRLMIQKQKTEERVVYASRERQRCEDQESAARRASMAERDAENRAKRRRLDAYQKG